MGCQKEIAIQIIDNNADYLLAVKNNQKILHQDIQAAFKVYRQEQTTFDETSELNGSRVEKRVCRIITDTSHIEQVNQWENLKTFIEIETEVYHKSKGKTTTEKRYYISSQKNNAESFLKATRNHWCIENKLHWSLDVIFKENQSRKRFKNVTENFSIILKTALKIMQEKQENKH